MDRIYNPLTKAFTAIDALVDRGAHQEVPAAPHGAHYHFCVIRDCDTYLTCFSAADRCPTPDKWICPTHEREALDAYLSAQESPS